MNKIIGDKSREMSFLYTAGAGAMSAIIGLFGSSPPPSTVERIMSNSAVQAAASSAASAVSSNSGASASSSVTAVARSPAVQAAVVAAAPSALQQRYLEAATAKKNVTKTVPSSASSGRVAALARATNARVNEIAARNEAFYAAQEATLASLAANEAAEKARRAKLTPAERNAENAYREKQRALANAAGKRRDADIRLATSQGRIVNMTHSGYNSSELGKRPMGGKRRSRQQKKRRSNKTSRSRK